MSKHTDAWAAGLFEGEGWLHIRRQWRDNGKTSDKFSLIVGMTNTDKTLLEILLADYGGNIRPKKGTVLSRKPLFEWAIYGQKAANFLRAIYPSIRGQKHDKIARAIQFQASFCLASRARDTQGKITRLEPAITEHREMLRQEINHA